ncbi:hypothetical protein [Ralstonia phage phiRSL1]|uniref:Transposase n=1 Tax=Ralstonia phage phiRSL1 TaxID=1980924 RepID=B2ZXQ4_9CAUD|nr:transposase [Ralstonia phage phiRSL1]BAG41479.1 hypothetical protein [Ralstonia phage phiRSL1]
MRLPRNHYLLTQRHPTRLLMDGIIRKLTRGAYDIQQLRIATGLRVVAQFRDRFNVPEPVTDVQLDHATTGEARAALDAEAKEKADKQRDALLKQIRIHFDRVTDGIVATQRRKTYHFDDVFKDETDVWFMENYMGILDQEQQAFKRLERALGKNGFYNDWLANVKGIGPAMAGVLISELDPYRAKYPSSFWKYSGLDVVTVVDPETHDIVRTEGRRNFKHHLVESTYTDRDGKEQTKMGLSYNPWLKTKLLAVMAPSFLKCSHPVYSKMYYDYKLRQLNRPELKDNKAVKAIAHKRALRYVAKMFLRDLHTAWRTYEGLEVYPSYEEAKLGMTHGRDPSAEAARQ